jgi:hypothetical protein
MLDAEIKAETPQAFDFTAPLPSNHPHVTTGSFPGPIFITVINGPPDFCLTVSPALKCILTPLVLDIARLGAQP